MSYRYKSRKFLNSDKTKSAHIIASVGKTELSPEGNMWGTSSEISISDCSRKITLDFYAGTKLETKQNMKKLDTLIKTLTDFRVRLRTEYNFIDNYKEPKKAE
jgi:hypothetical protein